MRRARDRACAGGAALLFTACGGGAPCPAPTTAATPAPASSPSKAEAPHGIRTVQKGTPADFRSRLVTEDTYPAHRVAFPGGVVGIPDVTYASLPGFRPLELDLYLPPGGGRRHPFVVFLHGGGWVQGSLRTHGAVANWPEVLASLAAKGYVVAAPRYRLMNEAPFPAAVQDAKSAVRFLRAHADEYGIDKARGAVWGASAGAQLASLVGAACGAAALEPPSPPGAASSESTCVSAVIGWFGVYDFTGPAAKGAAGYLRCGAAPCSPEENAKLASAATHLDAKDPPFLLVQGDADASVPVEQSKALHAALLAKGVKSELVLVPGADHALLGPTAEATQKANEGAVERTFGFIDGVLGAE